VRHVSEILNVVRVIKVFLCRLDQDGTEILLSQMRETQSDESGPAGTLCIVD